MVLKSWESENGIVITIDHDKCAAHSKCIEVCPVEVYELIDGKAAATHIDECIECCACVEACPVGAIRHSSC